MGITTRNRLSSKKEQWSEYSNHSNDHESENHGKQFADKYYQDESLLLPKKTSSRSKIYRGVFFGLAVIALFFVIFEVRVAGEEDYLAHKVENKLDGTVASPNYAHHHHHAAAHDGKKEGGGIGGAIGAYLCLGLICSVRWAVCWNCLIKQQARNYSDVASAAGSVTDTLVETTFPSTKCCQIWSYIACGCNPGPFMDACKTAGLINSCTCPMFWLEPWNWVAGPWGCCTIKPCCYPYIDKCCGTVYPENTWNADAINSENRSTTETQIADSLTAAAVEGQTWTTPVFG